MTFQGRFLSCDDDFEFGAFEPEAYAARIGDIPSAAHQRKEFRPFTSTLSGALMLGLYIGWASIFVF